MIPDSHRRGSPLSPLLASWQKFLLSERVTAGNGLAMSQTGAGKVLYLATNAAAHPFKVTIDGDGNIAVNMGRHHWYDTGTGAYTKTEMDSSAGAWSAVAQPTAGNTKFVYVTREHDSGAVTTATAAKGIGTSEATILALANEYTRVWIIAKVSADSDGVVTVEQRWLEDIEDGPDCRTPGTIWMWKSTTLPRGWGWYTTLQERFPAGYKSGSTDYGTMEAATGGYATHGDEINDHLPHKVNHSHPVTVTPTCVDVIEYCAVLGIPCVTVLASVDVDLNCICDDLLDDTPPWWCRETDTPADTSQIEDGASHGADAGENVAWHSSTDNRPPFTVIGFIVKL